MTRDKAVRLGGKVNTGAGQRLPADTLAYIRSHKGPFTLDGRGRLVGEGAATGGTDEGSRIAAQLMREGVVKGDSLRYVDAPARVTLARAQAQLAELEIGALEDRVAGATGQAKRRRVSRADAFVATRVAEGMELWEARQALDAHMELEARRLVEREPGLEYVAGQMVRNWFAAAA